MRAKSADLELNVCICYLTFLYVDTGQSTGGGVATLLGFLLYKEYPKLQVFSYSPPGTYHF